MKKLLLALLLLSSAASFAGDHRVLLDSANAAYAANRFEQAAAGYEKILADGMEAPEVYYNLGNAYFKSGKIAKAILNYERAKKISPADEDILNNLKLANQRTADKIEALPNLFLDEWKDSFLSTFSERGWSLFCILSVVIGLGLFTLYVVSSRLVLRQTGFWGGCLVMLLAIATFFIARHEMRSATLRNEAVIMESSVTVKGSPDEKGTKLFVLHEGTKVSITDSNGDWLEVKLSNGSVGWLKKTTLEQI